MSVVPLERVLDIRAFEPDRLDLTLKQLNVDDHHDKDHHHHGQQTDVKPFTIRADGECKSNKDLEIWLGNLMWENTMEIYRVKGEIAIVGDEYRYIIQGVHDNFEISKTHFKWSEHLPSPTSSTKNVSKDNDKDKRSNQLVIIGKNLPLDEIEKSFKQNVIA